MIRATMLVCVTVSLASSAGATTLRVGPGQDYSDVQSAVDASAPGDLVLVDPGGIGTVYCSSSRNPRPRSRGCR
jgi:hypothetical protein